MIACDGTIVEVSQAEGGYTFNLLISDEVGELAQVNLRPEEWAALNGAVELFKEEFKGCTPSTS